MPPTWMGPLLVSPEPAFDEHAGTANTTAQTSATPVLLITVALPMVWSDRSSTAPRFGAQHTSRCSVLDRGRDSTARRAHWVTGPAKLTQGQISSQAPVCREREIRSPRKGARPEISGLRPDSAVPAFRTRRTGWPRTPRTRPERPRGRRLRRTGSSSSTHRCRCLPGDRPLPRRQT
jgi:hypothetical protein